MVIMTEVVTPIMTVLSISYQSIDSARHRANPQLCSRQPQQPNKNLEATHPCRD